LRESYPTVEYVGGAGLHFESSADPHDLKECKGIWTDAKLDTNQLSLSWWLAAAMQAEIDVQRCDKNNRQTLADILRLSPQDGATP
jgi:hypothetical protein